MPVSPLPVCYFSFNPSYHHSIETPLATPEQHFYNPVSDPCNPLLAQRSPSALLSTSPSYSMEASKLMGLQTAAAYNRPKPQPTQASDKSTSSGSDSETSISSGYVCSRCQRHGIHGFVSYSVNSYYCHRCASIVGYGQG
jgi:hypothetical protein